MSKATSQVQPLARPLVPAFVREITLIVSASLFVALCARLTLPLPFTPVPLTLQNFGVLLVGMMLGARRGFAALVLYLAEGTLGMPVFNPTGPGGLAQLLGPTGGYLIAYPLVAAIAGFFADRGRKWLTPSLAPAFFAELCLGAVLAEALLFAAGVGWLVLISRQPLLNVARLALYPFLFAEVIKIMAAAGLVSRPGVARLLRS
ncbi:MAG TPA: biotin transporter BioY [Terriglobales bacterium]|nr:biotin transporter BioY [Terriglobales bacterium]